MHHLVLNWYLIKWECTIQGQFIISTRVRCGRSLEGYPFNPCLTEAQYAEMEQKVSSTLSGLEGELKGTYYPLTGMTKEVQQQLIDDHFLFKEGDRFLQVCWTKLPTFSLPFLKKKMYWIIRQPMLAATGQLVAVSTTTSTRLSWSGATKRITFASSRCRRVVTSRLSMPAWSTLSTILRRGSPSLTTTASASWLSARPTWAPPSEPPSTSSSPSWPLIARSSKRPPESTTSR